MLTLNGNDGDTLWDHLLPEGARVLPADLARLDDILGDPGMVAPFRARFQAEAAQMASDLLHRGRLTSLSRIADFRRCRSLKVPIWFSTRMVEVA